MHTFTRVEIINMKSVKRILRILLAIFLGLLILLLIVNLWNPAEPIPEISGDATRQPNASQKEWWEGTTVYQVYPRSYQDSDGDGIGDLGGIISRLDYIKNLGFETIWLSPFFKSPQKDYGYDVSDYYLPDPVYGDTILVDSLIREIHRRDLKVVFDLVLNHTSEEHPWFEESRSDRDNPKSDWYVWKTGVGDEPPTNWHSALGMNGWHYEPGRDQWYFSSFLSFQPDLNWRNPAVREAMFDVVRYWLDKGVDGFRLDIFNYIFEDPEFRDNPFTLRVLPDQDFTRMFWQEKKYTMNHPDDFELARELRTVLSEYSPPRFLVGEVFGDHKTLRKFLGPDRDGLNLVFLFDISELEWDAGFFRESISRYEAFYPEPYLPTYVFSNHDRVRSISLLDNDFQKAKTLALLQLTVRGVPFFYQGEEIGMGTGEIPNEKALDPLPGAFDWLPGFMQGMVFNRDNCRTPMQWGPGPNADFTSESATPWLPVLSGSDTLNVEQQWADPQSLLNTNQKLLSLRKQEAPLQWGSLQWLSGLNQGDLLAYERVYNAQKIKVLINFSKADRTLEIGEGYRVLFATGKADLKGSRLVLAPNTGVLLK